MINKLHLVKLKHITFIHTHMIYFSTNLKPFKSLYMKICLAKKIYYLYLYFNGLLQVHNLIYVLILVSYIHQLNYKILNLFYTT